MRIINNELYKKDNSCKSDIMIIVPHADDETLMTGGIIHKAVKDNLNINVVIVTNGDYFAEDYSYGQQRIRETIEVLGKLGLSKEHIWFFGYADTGFEEEVSFITKLYHAKSDTEIFPSTCSDHTYGIEKYAEDYHTIKYGEHAKYCRKHFMMDLKSIIKECLPQNIFTTSLYDLHGDHSGLYLFTIESLKDIISVNKEYKPNVYHGIVHSTAGDQNWPSIEEDGRIESHNMPYNLEEKTNLKWEDRFVFNVEKELLSGERSKNLKYLAIKSYKSQMKPDVKDYLLSFVKKDEFFWQVVIE